MEFSGQSHVSAALTPPPFPEESPGEPKKWGSLGLRDGQDVSEKINTSLTQSPIYFREIKLINTVSLNLVVFQVLTF